MLAGSAPDVAAALTTLGGEVVVETKLDGIRLQAHVDNRTSPGTVRLFTRTLDEVTDRMPEITEALAALDVETLVLDGEVIALGEGGRPQPFQVTGARTASSADVARLREEVPLTPYFFDVLHLDGDDLLDEPAATRWARLAQTVPPAWLVPRERTDDPERAQQFFDDLVAAGHEGVVVKDPALPYAAGRRGPGWVKVKPRHTLDLVVLAVEWGSGRRKGWLSNIHLGARDADTGELVMLGKTFKGMTDEMLAWQTRALPTSCATERGDWVVRRATRAGRRDRLRRRAALDPLPRRHGAALRPGAALPRRQAGLRDRHRADREVARRLVTGRSGRERKPQVGPATSVADPRRCR